MSSGGNQTCRYRVGCIPDRVGGNISGSPYRRPLVIIGKKHAHKLSGNAGSNVSSEDLPERSEGQTCPIVPGQHHGSGIHKPPGGNSVLTDHHSSKGVVDVVHAWRGTSP